MASACKTDPWNRQLDLSISLGKLGDARLRSRRDGRTPKPEDETRALSEPAFADRFISGSPVPAAPPDEAAEKSREFALSK